MLPNCCSDYEPERIPGFNGHPPLGVNATLSEALSVRGDQQTSFNGHPPLGVNATTVDSYDASGDLVRVSMGTHPWG